MLINWLDDSGKEVLDNSSAAKFSLPATTLRFHLHATLYGAIYVIFLFPRPIFT